MQCFDDFVQCGEIPNKHGRLLATCGHFSFGSNLRKATIASEFQQAYRFVTTGGLNDGF